MKRKISDNTMMRIVLSVFSSEIYKKLYANR